MVDKGKCSLQVPDLVVAEEPEYEEVPDRWLCRIHNGGPAVGKQFGFLYLTETGFEANKDELKKRFEHAISHGQDRGHTWADFEKMAKAHFTEVKRRVRKLIADHKAKLAELRQFTA